MSRSRAACQIRVALPDDAAVVSALINRAFSVEAWFVDGDRATPDDVRRLIEGTGGAFLLADDEGGVIACVYAERRSGTEGYIGLLAVDESRQGMGIGPWLMGLAEQRLAAAGCTVVEITVVDRRAELFPLYERLGYRARGTKAFPRVSKVPCVLVQMVKTLSESRETEI